MLGVSESDMINYHSVFADSGNSGAQVRKTSVISVHSLEP